MNQDTDKKPGEVVTSRSSDCYPTRAGDKCINCDRPMTFGEPLEEGGKGIMGSTLNCEHCQLTFTADQIRNWKAMSTETTKVSAPRGLHCYADIYAGGNINGLAIIKGSKTMDVGKALDLIHRTYNALHKGHWQEGESETELCSSINDYMSNMFGPDWSA